MVDLINLIGSLGVGALLGLVILFMYRQDRRASEKRHLEAWRASEERLSKLLERDQQTREDNTKMLAEVKALLNHINGRLDRQKNT